jgi:hypothetical protein
VCVFTLFLKKTVGPTLYHNCLSLNLLLCRSQWPRDLRRRTAAALLLRSWIRISPGAWMFVCCVCCVLSGRGLCDEPITRPEESYRKWYVWVWFRNLVNEEALAHWGLLRQKQNKLVVLHFSSLMTRHRLRESCKVWATPPPFKALYWSVEVW